MNGMPYPRRPPGRGRGQNAYPDLEFWEDRPGRNPGTSLVKRDPVSGNFKLHVRSIPSNWNPTIFENIFSRCGDPQNIYISPQRLGPGGMTWGFVEFKTYQEACNAVHQLNNNVLLNIQVMFAREKEEEVDPILQLISSEPEEDMENQWHAEPTPAPLITRTVRNEAVTPGPVIQLEKYQKAALELVTQKSIEESLFQKRLDIYQQGECYTAKCSVCEVSCSMACSGCASVYYCSENCQNKDWSSHSRNCKGSSVEDANSQGSGDHRQARSEFTNGFGSSDSDNRNNRFGDRKNNRDSERGFNRDSERGGFNRDSERGGFNRDSERGGFNRDRNQSSYDQQDRSQGKKSVLEERKQRMATSNRNNENDRGFQNRFGQNNQRSHNDQETRSSFKPRVNTMQAEEDWGSETPKGNDVKDSQATTPGTDFINKEKAFLQDIELKKQDASTSVVTVPEKIKEEKKEDANVSAPVVTKIKEEKKEEANVSAPVVMIANLPIGAHLQQLGKVLKVLIVVSEGQGSYWVQLANQVELKTFVSQLREYFKTCTTQFTPVKDGICGINYEETWYRCQIVSLEPLSVNYIDFGYPEEVEANRLFELSPELLAIPPYAFNIKLAEGTQETFLVKGEADILTVKLIKKIDNYWLAQVVDVNVELPEVPKAVTPSDPPVPMTTPTPTTEPSQNGLGATRPDVSPQNPSAKQLALSQPPAELPFPSMFDATNFSTVIITYVESSDKGDTYYVGAGTIWNALSEMCDHFLSIIDHCEVVATPRNGTMGVTKYSNGWYRVKVISLSPLEGYFIDYGNKEQLEPQELRKCPETHKDIPNLVHKIKLAPGTDQKYFNLPDYSQIKVKPVCWLADSTILVEVEGENDIKTSEPTTVDEKPLSPAPTTVPECTSSAPTPTGPLPDAHSGPVESKDQASSKPSSVQIDLTPKCSPSTVDSVQENWKISFVPNKIDYVKNSLLGQVYSENIPTTVHFIADNEKYQDYLSSLEFDPDFSPSVGEVVGLLCPSGEWERGTVLPQPSLVAFTDHCGVIRSFQLFKLPESYSSVPSMAAMFTLLSEDPDMLSRLVLEDEIIFDVVKVKTDKGHTVVDVTTTISQKTVGGELRTWVYEPLETPNPLASGDLVTISRVLDSNTMLVATANDLEIQQAIQIDCTKLCEEFKSPPKEGDYVSFWDNESDSYSRCRIDQVDKDEFTIYAVDNASYHQAKLCDLHPLPSTLRNVPCRISQIDLKGVEKVDQTEEAQCYLSNIFAEDKFLKIDNDNSGKATLTIEGEEGTVNSKLKELLKPKVVPNSDGKLTILSLPELGVPLNQEFDFIVCQTEPLYIQLVQHSLRYYTELHNILQDHCASDNALYNPCEGELCLAQFEGDWYRCRCLKETNTGMSVLMLVDYGNMFNGPTTNIRRILPEMLTLPSIAISCKIHDLPASVSPALKNRIGEILEVNKQLHGTFVAEHDRCYEVVIEDVKKAVQELQ